MPSYNDSLNESLRLLYNYLLQYRVSIDLIQKLAQHLKLDTFVDTDVQEATPNIKRLSIAGSLLLVDIDFADDHTATNVSLSLGNHTTSVPSLSDPTVDTSRCIVSVIEEGLTTVVNLSFLEENLVSFLKTRKVPERSVAELILLATLSDFKLGHFPANLKHLANLDNMSPPDGDLVLYLDNIALYLSIIHEHERKLKLDWEVEAGFTNRIGKVVLNDVENNRLGVFIRFWEESRLLNRQAKKTDEAPFGKTYEANLSIEETDSAPVDYLKESKKEIWELTNPHGNLKSYRFTFDGDQHLHKGQSVTSLSSQYWNLTLNLDEAVFLPLNLVEFLGLTQYLIAPKPEMEGVFGDLEKYGKVDFVVKKDEDETFVSFLVEDPPTFVAVKSLALPSLVHLSKVIPALRNHIVFSTLIRKVFEAPDSAMCDSSKTELSAEASKKLKESLKLSTEVTDEELLSLNTMTENTYMGMQMFQSNTDLENFVKKESTDDIMDDESEQEGTASENTTTFLSFSLSDVSFDSPDTDLNFTVKGRLKSGAQVESLFKIKNGQIMHPGDDVAMDSDTNVGNEFIDVLALCEDPLVAFQILG